MAVRASGRAQGLVFQGKKAGEYLTKLNNAHDAVVEKSGSSFVFYEFRHTLATQFGEAVGDPLALATILGHGNLKTVMNYCHVRESHTTKAMEKFIGSFEKPKVQVSVAGSVNLSC